jgi:hypothetical protein
METLVERDENEAFAPEKPTQEKWNELLAVVRRAEVLRTYMYGFYGAGGGMSSYFKNMMSDLSKLVMMVLREEVRCEQQQQQPHQQQPHQRVVQMREESDEEEEEDDRDSGFASTDSGFMSYTPVRPCHGVAFM